MTAALLWETALLIMLTKLIALSIGFRFAKRWSDWKNGGNHTGRILTFRAHCVEPPDVPETLRWVWLLCLKRTILKAASHVTTWQYINISAEVWESEKTVETTFMLSLDTDCKLTHHLPSAEGPVWLWWDHVCPSGSAGGSCGVAELIWGWTKFLNQSTSFTFFLFAVSSVFTAISPNPGSSHLPISRDSRLRQQEMLCRRGSPLPASRAFKTNKSVITGSVIKIIWLASY